MGISYVERHLAKQLVYNIFITTNHAAFHLWGKESFLKYQVVRNIMTMVAGLRNGFYGSWHFFFCNKNIVLIRFFFVEK